MGTGCNQCNRKYMPNPACINKKSTKNNSAKNIPSIKLLDNPKNFFKPTVKEARSYCISKKNKEDVLYGLRNVNNEKCINSNDFHNIDSESTNLTFIMEKKMRRMSDFTKQPAALSINKQKPLTSSRKVNNDNYLFSIRHPIAYKNSIGKPPIGKSSKESILVYSANNI